MLGRIAAIGFALAIPLTSVVAEPIKFKFAVPASLTTPRGVVAKRFADDVAKNSKGEIIFEIFPDSQLFAGAEEPKALSTGAIDVAIPNLSLVASIEPNADIYAMPLFFGATSRQVRAVMDGAPGQDLAQRIERRLQVKVLGAAFDNGPDIIVTSAREPKTLKDLAGLKIRAPGGPKYSARLQALGASPIFIRFEDLALALTQGTVDGVMTNDGGVVQGKLWELGIKHSVAVDLGWAPLAPMMSERAWGRLGAENQKMVVATWNGMLGWARDYIDEQLSDQRRQMAAGGIKFYTPDAAEVQGLKDKLDALQPALAKETRVDDKLLADVTAILKATPAK